MSEETPRVALVTGANRGIGLALATQLASHGIHVVMGCRDPSKGEEALAQLRRCVPTASVELLVMDLSDPAKVVEAAAHFRERHTYLHLLYLNAGVASFTGRVNTRELFSWGMGEVLRDGKHLLEQTCGRTTEGGLGLEFASNVFGHFLLIHELLSPLENAAPSTIVWTSSRAASAKYFSFDDVQMVTSRDPYGGSKFACDLLSMALAKRLRCRGIYSFTTCPGLTFTNLMTNALHRWEYPFLWLMSKLIPSVSLVPERACVCLTWFHDRDPSMLDPQRKYLASAGRCMPGPLRWKEEDADRLYDLLEGMVREITKRDA